MRRSPLPAVMVAWIGAALLAPPLLALDPSKALTQYLLTVWQTEHGLPQNSVYTIRQTRDGYLWLGTEEGLVRFDGVRFVVYDKRNTPEIRHNWIQSLHETADGALWMAIVGGGLTRYKDGEFKSFTTAQGLPHDSVWDLAEDTDRSLWIATDAGLARMQHDRITKVATPHEQLRALHRARDGSLWIGTDGEGLLKLANGRFETWTTANGLSSDVVWDVRETRDGSIWIATAAGLDRLQQDGTFTHVTRAQGLPSDYIRGLLEDREGTLWIATSGGIARHRDGVFTALSTGDGLSTDDIRTFFEDREGNLFVGTGGGGFARLRDGLFTVYGTPEGLFGENVRAVMQDRQGAMWVGGRGGLTRLQGGRGETFTRAHGLSGDLVYALFEGRDGTLWIGTENGLTARRNERFTSVDGLSHDAVRALTEDARGRLWVGTEGGLNVREQDGTFRSYSTKDGLSNNAVLALHPARDGSLWIGTRQGLNLLTSTGIVPFRQEGLERAPIIAIHEDADGTLWFASGAVGLFRFANGRVTRFTSNNGLFDDTLMETLEDGAGNFWIGCNRGVFRVPKRELVDASSKVRSFVYGVADGLRSAECNGASQPAGWKASDGSLWFATIRGVARVDPARLQEHRLAPLVAIEQVRSGNRLWNARQAIHAPAGSNDVEIQYTGISLGNPERVRFRYQLEGFDSEWVDAGDRRSAFYTNLPPGDYRFRVIACNEDSACNETRAPLQLTIAPLFHQTLAFRIFLGILGIAAIWVLDRARAWRVKKRERQLTTLVAERTHSLELALAEAEHQRREAERQHVEAEKHRIEAEEANRAKSTFLASMSHELRTPMNSIIGFSEILAQRLEGKVEPKLHNFLTLVRTSSQHLLSIINDILDLTKVELGKMEVFPEPTPLRQVVDGVTQVMSSISARADVIIRTEVADDIPTLETDAGKLKQILFNLLSNGVKFSPRGSVIVLTARRAGDLIEIAVTDHGPGIAPDDLAKVFEEFRQLGPTRNTQVGTGLGLSLVKKFSELLRGSVRVESRLGHGTTFALTLPVRYSAASETEPAAISSGPTVVVIDDDDAQWHIVRDTLQSSNFNLMRIQSGREALARLRRIAPSAAVLDLALRGGEGWEVLRALRADAIPVIVITSADDSHPAMELRGAEVLIKPVQPAKLIERLRRVVRSGQDAVT